MRLLWLHYTGTHSRYILLLELGERDGKICGIETKVIDSNAKSKIRSAATTLAELPFDKRMTWIREYCPQAMGGYKEILKHNAQIISTYPIDVK